VLWSLYSFLTSPDGYWETICTAIAVGGDVDATAAMAEAMSGAFLGLDAIPDDRSVGYALLLMRRSVDHRFVPSAIYQTVSLGVRANTLFALPFEFSDGPAGIQCVDFGR
jgi:hypothetical protein